MNSGFRSMTPLPGGGETTDAVRFVRILGSRVTVTVDQDGSPTQNAKQTITIDGSPNYGGIYLPILSQTSPEIPFDATASDAQTILEGMASVGSGNVDCTGGPFPDSPISIEFTGALGNRRFSKLNPAYGTLAGGKIITENGDTAYCADGKTVYEATNDFGPRFDFEHSLIIKKSGGWKLLPAAGVFDAEYVDSTDPANDGNIKIQIRTDNYAFLTLGVPDDLTFGDTVQIIWNYRTLQFEILRSANTSTVEGYLDDDLAVGGQVLMSVWAINVDTTDFEDTGRKVWVKDRAGWAADAGAYCVATRIQPNEPKPLGDELAGYRPIVLGCPDA